MKNTNKNNAQVPCDICGEGHVMAGSDMAAYEYHGKSAMLPVYFLTCDTCASEFAGAKESRASKRAVLAFRKQVDGLLAGSEIEALRKRYNITQGQAAKLFGGGPVAFSKYENDDVVQSEAMDKLLRLIRKNESAFLDLVDECGMTEELFAKAEAVTELKVVGTSTKVVRVNFGDKNEAFLPSSKVQSRTTHAVVSDDTQEQRQWK